LRVLAAGNIDDRTALRVGGHKGCGHGVSVEILGAALKGRAIGKAGRAR